MADKYLSIPCAITDISMVHGVDNLFITVTGDCTWSYSDKDDHCFGKNILPAGRHNASSKQHGPYTPKKTGSVSIDAKPDSKCPERDEPYTPHSITIS